MKEQELVEELIEYFENELGEARASQSPFTEEEIETILKALRIYKIG